MSATGDDGVSVNEGVLLDSGERYPAAGAPEVFGWGWSCDNGCNSSLAARGCRAQYPADLDDEWELPRVRYLPKHCSIQNCTRTVYVRDTDSKVYRVTYWQDDKDDWPYGEPKYRSKVKVERCDNPDCSSRTTKGEKYVYYDLVDQFVSWDNGAGRGPKRMGYFSQSEAGDPSASNTCAGWDGNADHRPLPRRLRLQPALAHRRQRPPRRARRRHLRLRRRHPLDWNDDHTDDVLARLAPDRSFAVSPYLNDDRRGSCSGGGGECYKDTDCADSDTCENRESFLRLKYESERPIIADGAAPLGSAVQDFREWYAGCASGGCSSTGGWEDIASLLDPDWACRQRYLLVLTDGDETCSGPDACTGTAALRTQNGVKTYVVALGVEGGSGNKLTCMAANGGTGEPIYPKNKQELVAALESLFEEIKVEARSFASASVPTVQNETSDKIYLSNFTPLTDAAVWPGRVDAFRKPLPLNADDTPDFGRACGSGRDAACHLWEAGEVLLSQAPTPLEADLGSFKLGLGVSQRRLLYPR